MPTVKFIKEKKEIEVPEGTNLRTVALNAGVNLYQGVNGWGSSLNPYLNCLGFGFCGTCRVNIKKGAENTNKMGFIEKFKFHCPLPDPLPCLSFIGHENEMRLACKTQVFGDIEVETGPEFNLFGENFFS